MSEGGRASEAPPLVCVRMWASETCGNPLITFTPHPSFRLSVSLERGREGMDGGASHLN